MCVDVSVILVIVMVLMVVLMLVMAVLSMLFVLLMVFVIDELFLIILSHNTIYHQFLSNYEKSSISVKVIYVIIYCY